MQTRFHSTLKVQRKPKPRAFESVLLYSRMSRTRHQTLNEPAINGEQVTYGADPWDVTLQRIQHQAGQIY